MHLTLQSTAAPRFLPGRRGLLLGLSAAIHVLFGLAVLELPDVRPPKPRAEQRLMVELVSPPPEAPQTETAQSPPERAQAAAEPVADPSASSLLTMPSAVAPPQAAAGFIRPRKLLSDSALSGAANNPDLRATDPTERAIQVCNVELLEQIHAAKPELRADYVVAYARKPVRLDRHTLDALGAALGTSSGWREVEYDCRLEDDYSRLTGFAYRLGRAIPQDAWDGLGLPSRR